MQCKNDKDVLEWFSKRTERVLSALFIEEYMEHNGKAYLKVNTSPPRTICRIKKSLLNKLQLTEMQSPAISCN